MKLIDKNLELLKSSTRCNQTNLKVIYVARIHQPEL